MSALPPLSAVLISLIAHASAGTAFFLLAIPIVPPVPEPELMAIMVEFVADPTMENDVPQEVRKGVSDSVVPEEAAPVANDIAETEETLEAETFVKPVELPDAVPIPVRKPRPERRRVEKQAPDKTKLALARGLEEDPRPDIPLGDDLQVVNRVDASLAYAASRGVTFNVQAEKRWLGRLLTHLERRKRYPSGPQSRRQQGLAHVRFVVAPDGTILTPELVRSSGVPELDEEVLDLMRRASPVPRPPADVNPFVTVPIEFKMKG